MEQVLNWMDYIRYGFLGFDICGVLIKFFFIFNPIPRIQKLWASLFPHRDDDKKSIVYYQASPLPPRISP